MGSEEIPFCWLGLGYLLPGTGAEDRDQDRRCECLLCNEWYASCDLVIYKQTENRSITISSNYVCGW